jgi:hypothetical protein
MRPGEGRQELTSGLAEYRCHTGCSKSPEKRTRDDCYDHKCADNGGDFEEHCKVGDIKLTRRSRTCGRLLLYGGHGDIHLHLVCRAT